MSIIINGKKSVMDMRLVTDCTIEQTKGQSTTSVMSQKAVTDELNKIYPVGAIYLSTIGTSPASLFGGTWERIKDRFLLSAGDKYTAGSTGGSANAVVVEHGLHLYNPGGEWIVYGDASRKYLSWDKFYNYGDERGRGWNGQGSEMYPAGKKVGESGTGKNMPPYLTVYIWKRTA